MTGISQIILDIVNESGFKAKTISISHIDQIREDIVKFQRQHILDDNLYEDYLQFDYNIKADLPDAKTIFIIAMHQPCIKARFIFNGKKYDTDIPPTYMGKIDDNKVRELVESVLKPNGFAFARTCIPLKTMAVRSGMAKYGKNNITYIDEFGSYHRLIAFISNCPCDIDNWNDLELMGNCKSCLLCTQNCPTKCIPDDRVLIHAEKCLTWYNERPGKFDTWISKESHNALIGCMRCQLVCPVNKRQLEFNVQGPEFTEEETKLLLQSPVLDTIPESTRSKLRNIGMDNSCDVIGRNLEALINNSVSKLI